MNGVLANRGHLAAGFEFNNLKLEQMNIRIELLNLQLKAPQLNAAEFAAKFSLIAQEYNRLQNLQQCSVSGRSEQLPPPDDAVWYDDEGYKRCKLCNQLF